jgi:hypothetical protein
MVSHGGDARRGGAARQRVGVIPREARADIGDRASRQWETVMHACRGGASRRGGEVCRGGVSRRRGVHRGQVRRGEAATTMETIGQAEICGRNG